MPEFRPGQQYNAPIGADNLTTPKDVQQQWRRSQGFGDTSPPEIGDSRPALPTNGETSKRLGALTLQPSNISTDSPRVPDLTVTNQGYNVLRLFDHLPPDAKFSGIEAAGG